MAEIEVEIVRALPTVTQARRLRLPEGTEIGEALRQAASMAEFEGLDPALAPVAVWGRRVAHTQVLKAGDRVEILRALTQDPKEARRRRVSRSGGS